MIGWQMLNNSITSKQVQNLLKKEQEKVIVMIGWQMLNNSITSKKVQNLLREVVKKKRIFYGQADRKG